MKFKLHDLQIFDALLKRLAKEQNPNSLPQYEPQLVILLYGQLVASDFFPTYIDGCPCQNVLQSLGQDNYEYFCGKITTPIDYHIIQCFYLKQFKQKKNPSNFFLRIQTSFGHFFKSSSHLSHLMRWNLLSTTLDSLIRKLLLANFLSLITKRNMN